MDCTQAKELMWENDLPEEFFEHIEACPECKNEYELVKKTKIALSSKDNMKERILVAATLDKRRRTALKITRIAAAFLVVFAVGIFARIAIDSGLKTANDSEMELAPTLNYDKAESAVGTTNNGFTGLFDGASKDDREEFAEEPMAPEEPMEAPIVESEEALEEEAPTVEDSIFSDDVCMLMNVYKDMHSLSYHSADIIVAGGDIVGVCDALHELGAVIVDSHIEIEGDFYFEAQDIVTLAGFDTLFASSSESVNKTLVYLVDLIK